MIGCRCGCHLSALVFTAVGGIHLALLLNVHECASLYLRASVLRCCPGPCFCYTRGAVSELSGFARHISAIVDGSTVSISEFELEQLIAVVDDDNSGTLDFEELAEMFDHIEVADPHVRSAVH